MARAPHMDALSQAFLLILKKVAFNQAVFYGRKTIPQTSKPGSDTNMAPGQSGAGWTEAFNELNNVVKMRHYSPKTLKTYSDWVSKLQTYTKSKDPRLVSVDDVKTFLTWLAVDQDVSASSQNQAFNALLFLFRNVFGKEFGKGQKDRTVPTPEALMDELRAQLERVIDLHERDCEEEYDGVFLYGLLEKKYKNAARELIWQ